MHTAPALRLTAAQIEQLSGYCAQYRSSLWQEELPTPERNLTLRRIQALQGTLAKAQEQREQTLVFSEEEQHTLKHLLSETLRRAARAPASQQRTQQVAEIAELRVLVERTFRPTPML